MKPYYSLLACLCLVVSGLYPVFAHNNVVVVPLGEDGAQAGVAKTGQSLCYEPPETPPTPMPIVCLGSGQDGEFQSGVAWPNPRFTDNNDGTVTDNLTRLIWLKNADCKGTYFPDNGEATRSEALIYINNLNNGLVLGNCGDLGFNDDWRLPNRFELESLLDLGEVGPPLPAGHPFMNVRIDYYWTSSYESYYGPTLGVGWVVHFSGGSVIGRSWEAEADKSYFWPVRGGF